MAEAYWFYEGEVCPCCQVSPVTETTYEGKAAVSINFFAYQQRRAIICYLLCGECMLELMSEDPNGAMPKHKVVEGVLEVAYLKYLNSKA